MEDEKKDNLNDIEEQIKDTKYNYPLTKINKIKLIIIIASLMVIEAIVIITICYYTFKNDDKLEKENIKDNELCDKGEEEKCNSCLSGTNNCASCNFRYILKDGKCFPNYSFRAEYKTTYENEKVELIHYLPYDFYGFHTGKINEMSIDEKEVIPNTTYFFESQGFIKFISY